MFGGGSSASGKLITPTTAMRISAAYACVTVLRESVGQLPMVLYRVKSDGSMTPAVDHPLYGLLQHMPNEEMTAQEGHEISMNHLLMRGNAYRQVVRVGGEVEGIYPLNPDRMRMYRSANGGELRYEYNGEDGELDLRAGQVWRTIGMTWNGINGVSPLTYAREAMGLALATEEHGAKLFSNGAQIATAFTHPGEMSEGAQKRFLASIANKYSGSRNAFKAIVLEEGMKVEKLGLSNVDTQFIESRKFQNEEICRFYRVPPHKIQDLARATFNNIEHLSMDFVNSSLMPWLVRHEQTANRDLLLPNERKKYVIRFDVDSLQRGDMEARANYYASGIANTWLNPNEARKKEFLNPREGGDVYQNPNTTSGTMKPGEPIKKKGSDNQSEGQS
jgi:HK97 family phage portal protein